MATIIPETPADFDDRRVIERPDGFYWQNRRTGEEYGPFATLAEAQADMEYSADADLEAGPADLDQAEDEIGIADWIDPDTGLPAEESIPRLDD
ncbi:MAG: hypothetical protein HY778_07290 [Betaproteobacteria bacterium]|nr:hypothetical protein [Betaproteobacteria bacterium]